MDGSCIAKSGFEQELIFKWAFNNDSEFRERVCDTIVFPKVSCADVISGKKHDVQLASPQSKQTKTIQVKKYKGAGFNQCDKRWHHEWEALLPISFTEQLSNFTGASFWPEKKRFKPHDLSEDFKQFLPFFQEEIVLSSLFKDSHLDFFFCFNENQHLTIFEAKDLRELVLSEPLLIKENRTTITLGKYMTWQKKGGDGGQLTATMLQTKLKTGKISDELLKNNKAHRFDFKNHYDRAVEQMAEVYQCG